MTKKTFCPNCGSHKMKLTEPYEGLWRCLHCGYQGTIIVQDGNLEKKLVEAKKMEKMSRKLLWRR